jgi:hypothetical protein
MSIKYEINNPMTGIQEEALSFEEAKQIKANLEEEYIVKIVRPAFSITVLVQNEDGSWTQSLADDEGKAIPPLLPENLD